MSADAILGTFVKIGTMADGTPRLVLDLQCTLSEVASMGLIPGVPFAIARLSKDAALQESRRPPETRMDSTFAPNFEQKTANPSTSQKPGQLCVMAVNFCKDRMFWRWLEQLCMDCGNEDMAKDLILDICRIQSRKELDTNAAAAEIFHEEIRKPFLAWREARRAA